jgi:hypothetical protein
MTTLIEEVATGQRNVTFRVSGTVMLSDRAIELPTKHTKLKLTSLAWLIEEKMGFYLSWDQNSVLMPLESRSTIRLDQAIPCPDNWQGSLWLRPFNISKPKMAFFIILDLDK